MFSEMADLGACGLATSMRRPILSSRRGDAAPFGAEPFLRLSALCLPHLPSLRTLIGGD
jgi:hypothetical protein